MKFTPGPWRYENRVGAGLQIYAPIPSQAKCVEFTLKVDYQPIYEMLAYETWLQFPPVEWTKMQEANARLIAKAPEMYEMLREIFKETLDDEIAQLLQEIDGETP